MSEGKKALQPEEMVNTYAPKQMIEVMERLPEGCSLVGNCVDKYGNWYNYPIHVFKVPGNNHMVCIQLKPIKEEYEEPYGYTFQLKNPEEKIFVVAENIADAMDKVGEAYPDREWEMINHSSVKVIGL